MTTKSSAYCDGWIAHHKDVPLQRNPYDSITQCFSHAEWDSGWCNRFSAAKHDKQDIFEDNSILETY